MYMYVVCLCNKLRSATLEQYKKVQFQLITKLCKPTKSSQLHHHNTCACVKTTIHIGVHTQQKNLTAQDTL